MHTQADYPAGSLVPPNACRRLSLGLSIDSENQNFPSKEVDCLYSLLGHITDLAELHLHNTPPVRNLGTRGTLGLCGGHHQAGGYFCDHERKTLSHGPLWLEVANSGLVFAILSFDMSWARQIRVKSFLTDGLERPDNGTGYGFEQAQTFTVM